MVGTNLQQAIAKLHELWGAKPPDMVAIEAAQKEYTEARESIISSINCRRPALGSVTPAQDTRPKCIHLGELIGKVKVQCKGCGGKLSVIEHAYFKCNVFKRCLPFFRGPWGKSQQGQESESYHLCHGCDKKELPPVEPSAESQSV